MILNKVITLCTIFTLAITPVWSKEESNEKNWQDRLDHLFGKYAVDPIVSFLFWEIPGTEFKVNQSQIYSLSKEQVELFSGHSQEEGNFFPAKTTSDQNLKLFSVLKKEDKWQKFDVKKNQVFSSYDTK